MATGIIALALLCALTTPTNWKDKNLDPQDVSAMEQLVGFAPPSMQEELSWILPENQNPPGWADVKKKVVIIQSWTNTDPKSRQIINVLPKLVSKTTSPEDVQVILVHTPVNLSALPNYQIHKEIAYPTILDTTGEVCNSFGFYIDPTNIIIDKNGTVQHVGLGVKGVIEAVNTLLEQPHDPKVEAKAFEVEETIELAKYPKFSSNFGRAKNFQGKQAPKFEVGGWVSNPVDPNGMVRVIEFWATWCAPCRKSIPHLNEYTEQFKDTVAIISVSNEAPEKVKAFMSKTPMEYSVAVDEKSLMKNKLACTAIPLALVVSSDGVVRWQGNPLKLSKEVIQQTVLADKGERVVATRGRWNVQLINE